MRLIKVDMHVHTEFSPDCRTKLEDLMRICGERGLNMIGVLDHNTIEGALRLSEMMPGRVIVGEEIKTTEGEVAGLFLKERIPPGLSPEETIERIREQNGLVYITHPFDIFRREVIRRETFMRIYPLIDAIEGFNARNVLRWSNRRAMRFARENGIPVGAGSDAHMTFEIGRGYVLMEPFKGREDFLGKLKSAQIGGKSSSFLVNVATKIYKIVKGV
jgi:hypothetical protein